MQFGIIGTSIWQQNQSLLESLTISRDSRNEALNEIRTSLGLDELVYLATCNRVEFIYSTSSPITGAKLLHRLLDHFFKSRRNVAFFPNDLYHYTDREMLMHLFRTAASLESLVVGETQITGQLKQAHEESQQFGISGHLLDAIISEALTVARRVKRDTSIGEGSLSMASLACNALMSRLGGSAQPVIALVGSGAMTRKLASHISKKRLGTLLFVNRTVSKVESFAEEFGGTAMSLDACIAQPPTIDAIVSATASSQPVFDGAFLDRLQARTHPIICIDLAVPRDFSPEFSYNSKVSFIDIPSLKSLGEANLRQKFVEANRANDIVRESVNQYVANQCEAKLRPIFRVSYQESLRFAHESLNHLFDRSLASLSHDERETLVRLVNRLVSHSSFHPVKHLSAHLTGIQVDINAFVSDRAAKAAEA